MYLQHAPSKILTKYNRKDLCLLCWIVYYHCKNGYLQASIEAATQMCSVEKKFWKLYQNSQQSTLKLNQLKKESITTIFLEIYWIFQNSYSTKSLWTVASSFQCLPNLFTKFMMQYTVSLQSSVTMSLPGLPSQTGRVNFLILSNFLSLERNTRCWVDSK